MTFSFLPFSPCQPDEFHFSLDLTTDENGSEVSWALIETYTDSIALAGNGNNNNDQTNVNRCLPAICYTFVITDTGNDGLCCDFGVGGFVVRMNGLKVAIGNEFGSSDEHYLPCTRPPTFSPMSTAPTSASAPVCVANRAASFHSSHVLLCMNHCIIPHSQPRHQLRCRRVFPALLQHSLRLYTANKGTVY